MGRHQEFREFFATYRRIALAGVLVLGMVLGAGALLELRDGAGVAQEPSVTVLERDGVSFEDWVPEVELPLTAELAPNAEPGTIVARWCEGSSCEGYLVRSDGVAFRLSDLDPDAAEAVAEQGFDGATLSPHAGQLGVRGADGGYRIFGLEHGMHRGVRPGPEGSIWQPVASTSSSMTLAQLRDDEVLQYMHYAGGGAMLDGWWRAPGSPNRFTPPDDFAFELAGEYMVEPADTTGPPDSWPPMTGYQPVWVTMAHGAGDGSEIGEVVDQALGYIDLSRHMRDGETLAGPRGVPVIRYQAAPEYLNGHAAFYTVFTATETDLIPTAVLPPVYGSGSKRLEIPESTADETWTLLGPMGPYGIGVLREERGSDFVEVIHLTVAGQENVMHTLPAGADVLVPGAIRW